VIVGAHVGETSLLTRAALTVANSARDLLVAQEGAFGTHLLARDVVRAASHVRGGRSSRSGRPGESGALPGWGLTVLNPVPHLTALRAAPAWKSFIAFVRVALAAGGIARQ